MAKVKFLAITILLMMVSVTGVSLAQEFDELKDFYSNEIQLSYANPNTTSVTAKVSIPIPKSQFWVLLQIWIKILVEDMTVELNFLNGVHYLLLLQLFRSTHMK